MPVAVVMTGLRGQQQPKMKVASVLVVYVVSKAVLDLVLGLAIVTTMDSVTIRGKMLKC